MTAILVNTDLCTRCNICSTVCITSIINPADEINLPRVVEEKAGMCIKCGHCEAFCPSQALLLDFRPDDKENLPVDAGIISSGDMAFYLKKRRSVRHFTPEIPCQGRRSSKSSILPVLPHQEATASR